MKTLVIVTHPDIEHSIVNKHWINELKKYPDRFTVHELYKKYSIGKIDVNKEHQLIEAHQNLILQFPIFNFSSPPLLKQWLDDVLIYGWAYGRENGDKLKGKKIALAVSAGIQKKDYQLEGRYHFTMEEILTPFKVLFKYYCHADYQNFYAFYGSEKIPGVDYYSTEDEIEQSTKEYLQFLSSL